MQLDGEPPGAGFLLNLLDLAQVAVAFLVFFVIMRSLVRVYRYINKYGLSSASTENLIRNDAQLRRSLFFAIICGGVMLVLDYTIGRQ